MSIQILEPINPYIGEPDYYRGRADAYDLSQTRTLDELIRLGHNVADHATDAYLFGYDSRVSEVRLERAAVRVAEIELAYTPLTVTR